MRMSWSSKFTKNLSAGANEAVVHTVEEGQSSSIVSLSVPGIEFW